MQFLSRLFLSIMKPSDVVEREREEAYLADAVDIYDLEFRLRKLDREKATRHPAWMSQR
ncbi:DUF3563 family protein [Paraburkholderia dinghuensis]|uniref:DUF3563 domain-containing protein n=1 Tax=Paraburkholderia dinghuensis TaxID=2305225 RepID=A0A3N6N4W7_9BURK|nr:DUF3563 family protein [Paraburkholderia dinghuensis]RQH05701.1 DUF3563 domain-containing protein [Paraburkholderia dinghuensis]